MENVIELFQTEGFVPYFLFGTMGIIAVTGIIFGCTVTMVRARAREASRREIAAYIAEGSMSPQDGERLMAAGEQNKKS